MHARRAQIGEQAELLAQAEDRLLGTLGALELVVARIADRAEEDRIGLLGDLQGLRRQRVAMPPRKQRRQRALP